MKLYSGIITLIVVISSNSFAQDMASLNSTLPVNDESKLISFEKVLEVPEVKKNEIFDRAMNWISAYYKNPTDVIRERNPDAGKILCKARFKIFNEPNKDGIATDAGVIQYTLTLQFKDGKYKYEITEFNWKQLSYYPIERWLNTSSPSYNKAYEYYLLQVNDYSFKTIADLEKNMAIKKKEKKENW